MVPILILFGFVIAFVLPLLLIVQLRELRRDLLDARQRLATLERAVGGAVSNPPPPVAPLAAQEASPPALPPRIEPLPRPILSTQARRLEGNWERFFGAKLFAWVGGFAAFLGAAFFLKYSFEHNLVPPAVRVTIGFVFGVSLIAAAQLARGRAYAVTAQTLTGTGIVVLYAAAFAAHSYYHLPAFGLVVTFSTMAVVTFVAIFLAVRRSAPVVAVLGVAGGFLTPALLATADLRPAPLFGYVAVLDAGLIAIVLRRGWRFLPALACFGTILVYAFWIGRYFTPLEAATAATVAIIFCAVFLGGCWLAKSDDAAKPLGGAAIGTSFLGLAASIFLAAQTTVSDHTGIVFGPTIAAVVTILAVSWRLHPVRPDWWPLAGLVATVAVEFIWQAQWRSDAEPNAHVFVYLAWILPFYVFPFIGGARLLGARAAWAVSALAPAVQFVFVHHLLHRRMDNPGLIPVTFCVFPALGLYAAIQPSFRGSNGHNLRVAWYAAILLLFIALVAPIQFRHEWTTLAWVLEGAALLWLYRRIPESVIQTAGVTLLAAAFVRLSLNPGVLEYHQRTAVPIWNWYLYTYAVAIGALYVGATLSAERDVYLRTLPIRRALNGAAIILLFILMNLEIADYFTPPGTRVLTFEFAGSFARDMSYTIGWSVFAFALLLVGIRLRSSGCRRAAVGLLAVALLKLFLHDLAELQALYRIIALFVVAAIAIAASVAYQRFAPDQTEP